MKPFTKTAPCFLAACIIILALTCTTAYADSTSVLPKGRSSISLGYITDHVTREFDDAGNDREEGYFLNNADVTTIAIPEVNPVINQLIFLFGGPPPPFIANPNTYVSLDLAKIYLEAEIDVSIFFMQYQYGVTDKLSVGIGIPYFEKAYTDVKFTATLIPSAQATASGYAPFIAAIPTDALVQNFLKTKLGYEELEDFRGGPGIGDVQVGAKYRWHNGDMFKFASGLGLTIPTGKPDDERNLSDIRYGGGSYNLATSAIMDFVPVDPLTLNFTGRYVWTFPFHRGIYILDKNNPSFYKKEFETLHVFGDYDTGDYFELETEVTTEIGRGIASFIGFRYRQTETARIDDDLVPKSIELERTLFLGLSANTIDAFQAGETPIPMEFSIMAEPMQTGKNVEKTERIYFISTLFF